MSDIDPERWKRIETILDKALEMRSDERTAFLENACGGDHELRREVERLLSADAKGSEFLPTERFAGRLATNRPGLPDLEAREGERIGPYRLLQRIGEGGMGVVYEAEQETPVRRRVALKIIKHGMDTKQVVARFEAERQALAMMDHPNVAKVFEAGATERGRPYFAMECVKGVSITEYCDRQRLSTRERLKLFMRVCEGVRHAHQKGIIHRDIKPSNILVQTEGEQRIPKIIDFGVAKATAQRLTERTLFTELGQMIGTPEYMSPEQAEMTGEDIDTRTDVYSLGVVLYELLVGALPFGSKELRKAGFDEIRRMIREDEPSKPSTRISTLGEVVVKSARNRRTDPGSLAKRLRGDLDWITMKALEKDRTRRYGSPSELEADVRRHLDNEPVVASPPSSRYRIGKFVRRHRIGVTIGTLAVLLLTAFVARDMIQASQIARERDRASLEAVRANSEAESAKQVLDFFVELFDVSSMSEKEGSAVTARQVFERGVEKIRVDLQDEPATQARLMRMVAQVYSRLGLWQATADVLEETLEIETGLFGEMHLGLVDTLKPLSIARLQLRDRETAVELSQRVVAICESTLGPNHPDVAEALLKEAMAVSGLHRSGFLFRPRSPAELETKARVKSLLERAIAIREKAFGLDDPRVHKELQMVAALTFGPTDGKGLDEWIRPIFQRMLNRQTERLGSDHPALVPTLLALATTFEDAKRREQHQDRALLIVRTAHGSEHPEVARMLVEIAEYTQDPLAKRERYEQALVILQGRFGEDHPEMAEVIMEIGSTFQFEGMGLRPQEAAAKYQEARSHYLRALPVFEKAEHPKLGLLLTRLGRVSQEIGNHEEAKTYFERELAIAEETLGAENPRLVMHLDHLAETFAAMGQLDDARATYERALTIQEKARGSAGTVGSLSNLGELAESEGDYGEALEMYGRAVAIEEGSGEDAGFNLGRLARVYRKMGQYDAAIEIHERLIAARRVPVTIVFAEDLVSFATTCLEMGDLSRAEELCERAVTVVKEAGGDDWHRLSDFLWPLATIYASQKRLDEAEETFARALSLLAARSGEDSAEFAYNQACYHALMDTPEKALAALNRAAERGYRDAEWMSSDKDLVSLHGRPEFEEIISKITAQVGGQ